MPKGDKIGLGGQIPQKLHVNVARDTGSAAVLKVLNSDALAFIVSQAASRPRARHDVTSIYVSCMQNEWVVLD